ncbi:MAG: tRNA (adenosine(37)-N6)-threonylcarbamoyltransferase complex ATPase subunit type 1 TsaE [Candidatus Berkiellales bacterium]
MILSSLKITVDDSASMEELGAKLCKASTSELIVALTGNLGAGKTTLIRGFLHAMGYMGVVKSPTYTLVEPYELEGVNINHFDFYRLNSPDELEEMGIRDYFQPGNYCLIEWADKAKEFLPLPDLNITIMIQGDSREVTVDALSERGNDVLQTFSL